MSYDSFGRRARRSFNDPNANVAVLGDVNEHASHFSKGLEGLGVPLTAMGGIFDGY